MNPRLAGALFALIWAGFVVWVFVFHPGLLTY